MTPTRCERCRREFNHRWALQTEARHIAATGGVSAAEAFVNDALADLHGEHRSRG